MPLSDGIALDEVVYFDVTTHVPSTGAVSDADSTPTFDVFEEATDTAILAAQNFTKRTSKTGDYRGTFTVSAANGFEVGKWYSVIANATVSSIAAKQVAGSFRCVAAEGIVGKPKVDVDAWLGTAAATPTVAGVPEVDVTHFGGTIAATPSVAGIPKTEATLGTDAADGIAASIIAAFGISGSAASAGASLASSDVDVFNLALDLLKEAPITAFTDDTAVAEWGLRNYVTARNAELREHPWKFALKRKVLYPTDFVLDGITATLTGAWAPFRLTERWTGKLVTLRRSSDSTSSSFGIDDDADPILIDASAVSTFVGTGSGYLSQLYDQSGSGNHIVQATTTKQPLYAAEVGDNAVAGASFDGSDDILSTAGALSTMMSTATGYMLVVGLIDTLTLDSATTTSNHLLMGDASLKLGMFARLGGALYGINDDGSVDAARAAVPLAVPFVAELRHESGTVYTRVNGQNEDSATSGATSSLAGVLNLGDRATGSRATDFNMFAAMTFSSIPTQAERDRIVSRLMRWAAVPGGQDFGWGYRYPIPADCIRMLPVRLDGEFEGRIVPHEIEQGYILTDQGAEIYARYIQEFTDASRFDPLFKEALAARLATKLAHWLTGKMAMVQLLGASYNTAIDKAKVANALEATPERPADEDVTDQRYDAEGVR